MTTLSAKLIKGIFTLVVILLSLVKLQSQCNPPDQLPTVQCSDAPLLCLQDACYSTTTQADPGQAGFCGNSTLIHNPQYFEIIPLEDCIEIHIHVDNCEQGSPALQSALVTSCDWVPCPGSSVPCPDVLDCDPNQFIGGTMVLSACGLTPGVSLWVVIDGSNASICQYTFTYVSGIFTLPIDEELDTAQTEVIPNIACQGFDDLHLVTGPLIANANTYSWTLGWNNTVITSTLPEVLLDIENNAPPGIWDICVFASSGCDSTENEVCVQVEIVEISDVVKEEESFCSEDFPFLWHDITIAGPGTYHTTFEDPDGCAYDSLWTVDAYPLAQTGVLDTVHCETTFVYEGEMYFISGSYTLDYPDLGVNGCDSVAVLNLTIGVAELFIEHSCTGNQSFLTPHLLSSVTLFDTITYQWYDCEFTELLSTGQNFEVSALGCYCLIINTGLCSDTICSTYESDPCDLSCSLAQDQICLSDSVLFTYDGGASPGAEFHWLIEMPGFAEAQYFNNDSVLLRFDSVGCYKASLTVVDDTSTITCIDSICVKVPATEASICCNLFSCQPCSDLTISLSGNAPWTIILSHNNDLDTVSGILTSTYVHTVCHGDTNAEYSLVEVFSDGDVCPGRISGDSTALIEYITPPLPTLTIADSFICVSGGFMFAWHECDSTTILGDGVCFVPTSSGCYCVDKIFSENCTLTVCTDFIVAIQDPENKPGITFFPNPTKGEFYIQVADDIPPGVAWEICDQLGIQHAKGILKERNSQIDLEKLPAGLYFISVETTDNHRQIIKVIID